MIPSKAYTEYGMPLVKNQFYLFTGESREIALYGIRYSKSIKKYLLHLESNPVERTRRTLNRCKIQFSDCFGLLPPPSNIHHTDIVEDFYRVDNGLYFVQSSSDETLFAIHIDRAEGELPDIIKDFGFPENPWTDYLFFHCLEFLIPIYHLSKNEKNASLKGIIKNEELLLAYLNKEQKEYVEDYNAIFDSKIPPIETPSPNYLEALDLTPLRWHIPAHTEKSS